MTPKTKLIKTIYLYLVAAVSLIFVAVGIATLFNTGLKMTFFPEAEKKSYYECNNQPPVAPIITKEGTTADQQVQIESMLKDYENWKANQSGENCFVPARQNKVVDALTMLLIALPILLIHWMLIKKDKGKSEN